jgi:hypothetical protein
MTRKSVLVLAMAIFSLVLLCEAAAAATRCPEGRLASGECVNPRLAASSRQIATIFSQPKISRTAFPIFPSLDRFFRYPNGLLPDQLKPAPTFSVSP